MNETMKKNLKRSLAAFLAVLMVAGLSFFAKDAALKADENAPEAEVVREVADAPAEPAPEPEPEVVVQEVVVPAPEPEAQPAAPADNAPAAAQSSSEEESAPAEEAAPAPAWTPAPVWVPEEEPAQEEAPAQAAAAPAENKNASPAEESPEAEEAPAAPAAPAKPAFNLEAAYEHYMSLAEEWQKEQYLNSLAAEDRAALRQYIADKEAEVAAAAAAQEALFAQLAAQAEENALMAAAAPEEVLTEAEEETGTEAETEIAGETEEADLAEEKLPAEEAVSEEVPAELPAEDITVTEESSTVEAEVTEEEPVEEELPAEEPAVEEEPEEEVVDLSFGSAHIGGEWAGRDTSSVRSLTINIYIDGALADTCSTSTNKSVANFVIYAGDNEITDVTTDYWELKGDGAAWSVDMYGSNNVTVNVNMNSLLPAGEEVPNEEAKATEETDEELSEEPTEETEPSYTVSEEWSGRETSTDRTIHLVFLCGEEVIETRDITGRNTEVKFSVAAEGYTVLSVEADAALANDGDLYTVDMNSIYEATVTVTLEAPAEEAEEVEEEENLSAEAEEATETEPSYEITDEWSGEETENEKILHLSFLLDGEEIETRDLNGHSTVISFTVDTEGYSFLGVETEAETEISGNTCSVDMSEADEADATVLLSSGEPDEDAEEENYYLALTYALDGNDLAQGITCLWTVDPEGLEIPEGTVFLWEETADGGETWTAIDNETAMTYQVILTEENINNLWRCSVVF